MKKRITYLIVLVSLLSSCSDWLDVSPVTEIREQELFNTESGYKDALTGVYIKLGMTNLYGKTVSMYVPEMITRNWTVPTESKDPTGYYLSLFDYSNSNVESELDAMWSNMYNAIAQINNIIENIEDTNIRFLNGNKDMIAGECYGLRAFLHLDLLRLYGPVPGSVNESNCIPYSLDFTTDLSKLRSLDYNTVISLIEEDLDRAEKLLSEDPLVQTVNTKDSPSSSHEISLADNWQYYRQIRFNYFAVLGAKARFYYWTGDKAKSLEYAKKVIEGTDKSGNTIFALTDENYFSVNEIGRAHVGTTVTLRKLVCRLLLENKKQEEIRYRKYI